MLFFLLFFFFFERERERLDFKGSLKKGTGKSVIGDRKNFKFNEQVERVLLHCNHLMYILDSLRNTWLEKNEKGFFTQEKLKTNIKTNLFIIDLINKSILILIRLLYIHLYKKFMIEKQIIEKK